MEGAGTTVVVLRGLTTGLALAEVQALGYRVDARKGRLLLGEGGRLELASGADMLLDDGGVTVWEGLDLAVEAIATNLSLPAGSVAVRAHRLGGRVEGCSTQAIAAGIGRRLAEAGCPIDLEQPQHVLNVVVDAAGPYLGWGWMRSKKGGLGVGARRAGERPFFRPVSLDPHLARSAVNLAMGSRKGVLLDAMTGTGGFLIEAALTGRDGVGLDLDPVMVEGTRENVAWALEAPRFKHVSVHQGDATRLDASLPDAAKHRLAGLVLDPPYGRNSHGSHGPWELLERVLNSTSTHVGPEGAGCCLILPIHPLDLDEEGVVASEVEVALLHGDWSDVTALFDRTPWRLDERRWGVRVHGSLGRLILLAACAPQG